MDNGRSSLHRLVDLWEKQKSDDPAVREAASREIRETGLRMTTPLTGIPDEVPNFDKDAECQS